MGMLGREELEQFETERLAPYAMKSAQSRGRTQNETPDPLRMAFQRDRDRVVHCSAFRKLERKTQVFLPFEGDYHRNRLTHTMEVAQIARTMARNLNLNEDLTEAIALAHDLGHPPFGHAGETALKEKMADEDGGFEHNAQGVRVLERLAERYPDRPGLNLTWETREGVAKHHTSFDHPNLDRFDPELRPPLESQVCDVADEIAYLHHDLDDALEFGILDVRDLAAVPWVNEIWTEAAIAMGQDPNPVSVKFRALGILFDRAVVDVLEHSVVNIERMRIETVDDVRRAKEPTIAFSPDTAGRYEPLRDFLMLRVYKHPRVVQHAAKAERFVGELFDLYKRVPGQLPLRYQARFESEGLCRVICDYIAGMTDRFCQEEYRNAFETSIPR